MVKLKIFLSQVLVAHACNPSYSGGKTVLKTLSQKTHHKKRLVEWLKVKALSSNLSTVKKKKRKRKNS
jgi:hypothetical protein